MKRSIDTFPLIFGIKPKIPKLGDGTFNPLQLIRIQIEQQVNLDFPFIHQVATTMTFLNKEMRVLEGALEFTLPDTATVCGYALDVDGELVDGVVVEKQTARIAFEKEVRKGIDPGFVELVAGNVFRTRVYPIRPNQTRIVRVIYQDQAVSNASDNHLSYRIPISFTNALQSFDLSVKCFGRLTNVSVPSFLGPSPFPKEEYPRFTMDGNRQYTSKWLLTNVPAPITDDYFIEYSVQDVIRPTMNAIEMDEEVGAYFALSVALPSVNQMNVGQSRSILILWDASSSRADAKESRQLEIDALKQILDSWSRSSISVAITLVVFRNDLETFQSFIYSADTWLVTQNILNDIIYDGATNLVQLNDLKTVESLTHCFMFSDCMSTFGQIKLMNSSFSNINIPIWIFNGSNSQQPVDHGFIQFLTERSSGGGYFNRSHLENRTNDLVKSIDRIQIKYIGLRNTDSNVTKVFPNRSISLSTTVDRFLVVGQVSMPINLSVQGELQFAFSHETSTVPFNIDLSSAATSTHFGLIRRLWAQQKLRELSTFKEMNRNEIIDIGLKYSLVTEYTSLMVLETLHQHILYRICPAKTRTKLYHDYLNYKNQNQPRTSTKQTSLTTTWQNHCDWYDKTINDSDIHRAYISTAYPTHTIPVNNPFLVETNFFNAMNPIMQSSVAQYSQMMGTHNPNLTVSFSSFGRNQLSSQSQAPLFAKPIEISASMPLFGGSQNTSSSHEYVRGSASTGSPAMMLGMQLPTTNNETADSEKQIPPAFILHDFDAQTSTIERMKRADSIDTAYQMYLSEKARTTPSPMFYFDVACFFFDYRPVSSAIDAFNQSQNSVKEDENVPSKAKYYGLRILTNILELNLEAPQLLRIVAYKLIELQQWSFALDLCQRVNALRPDEPQSLYDLALILIQLKEDQKALEFLKNILDEKWDVRFQGIGDSAMIDYNRLLVKLKSEGTNIQILNDQLLRYLPMDIRIILQWDEPDTSLSLSITEPTGQVCSSVNAKTGIGGLMVGSRSSIFSQLTNLPKEYRLRKAIPGSYSIHVTLDYYRGQTKNGTTTAIVYIFKCFGSRNEEMRIRTVRLNQIGQTINIGQLEIGGTEAQKLEKELDAVKEENRQLRDRLSGIRTSKSSPVGVHEDITCDSCGITPIVGIRYKCLFCPNLDFCEYCYLHGSQNTLHDIEHPMICIQNSNRYPRSLEIQNWSHITHENTKCSFCHAEPIVGPKYYCGTCNINLCKQCEFANIHDAQHPTMKLNIP